MKDKSDCKEEQLADNGLVAIEIERLFRWFENEDPPRGFVGGYMQLSEYLKESEFETLVRMAAWQLKAMPSVQWFLEAQADEEEDGEPTGVEALSFTKAKLVGLDGAHCERAFARFRRSDGFRFRVPVRHDELGRLARHILDDVKIMVSVPYYFEHPEGKDDE